MGEKAVCLLSGGLDSSVSSYQAKQEGYGIYALSFRYGQRHEKELRCAQKIAKSLHVKNHIIVDIDSKIFTGSSLLKNSSTPLQLHDRNESSQVIPSTYVPARNTVFLSLGLAYAESIEADAIVIGANAVDYSGYPDCRPEYIKAFQQMANLATKQGVEGCPITIFAPLLNFSKAEIIRTGVNLGVPFQDTWSCYSNENEPCGECESCHFRLKAFQEAGVKDPLLN